MRGITSFLSLVCSAATLLAQDRPRIVSPEVQADRRVVLGCGRLRHQTFNCLAIGWAHSHLLRSRRAMMVCGALPSDRWHPTYTPMVSSLTMYGPAIRRAAAPWPGRVEVLRAGLSYLRRLRRYGTIRTMRPEPCITKDSSPNGSGFAEVMFDNLLAQGKMVSMIVVMHASDVLESAKERRGDENLREFEAILVDELLPVVRQRYRVNTDPRSWAIAGLSLGGEFGMFVGLKHPELFRAVASLSGSLVPNSFDNRFGQALANSKTLSRDYRLIWVGGGSEDIFFGGAKAFAERLQAGNIRHVFRQFAGPHIMPVFRQELAELLPLLFR